MRRPPISRTRTATVVTILLAAVAAAAALSPPSTSGQEPPTETIIHLPLSVKDFAGPYPTVQPYEGTRAPTRTVRPTRTNRPTATTGPTATPFLPGEPVEHPTNRSSIVMQIGWTATNQVSSVWQQMEGTPWLTLYGDGRLIAGHNLIRREQRLYEGQVTEFDIQRWLRHLAYMIGIFQMEDEYDHTLATKPEVHIFVNVDGGYKRVTIRGYDYWLERKAPDFPGASGVKRLAEWIKNLEGEAQILATEEYQPREYTILAQQLRPNPILPEAPHWPHSYISIEAVADAAPLAPPSPVDRLVGHMFVDGDTGKEIWDIVVPVADQQFPLDNRSAQFESGGRHFGVGARQEVPGGSRFLPDYYRHWYRSDIDQPEPPEPLGRWPISVRGVVLLTSRFWPR